MVAVPKSGSSSGGGGGHGIPEGELLSTLALVGLIYFTAAGGAYGSESVINSVGPLPVIISHAIFPFCWSLPIGLATTELATAYPSDGGIAVWAALAFRVCSVSSSSVTSWLPRAADHKPRVGAY